MKTTSSYLISQSQGVGADKYNRGLVLPVSNLHTQAGVVLAISLIILLLLTIIGLSVTQTTALEEKMAGNLRDKSLAFQAAESALRIAELRLNPPLPPNYFTAAGTAGTPVTAGLYLDVNPLIPNPIPTATIILTDNFWSSNPNATLPTPTGLGNVIDLNPPLYIIQKLPEFQPPSASNAVVTGTNIIVIKCQPYKVTVRATGGTTNTVVVLQSIVVVPPCP
jgi:type IV pilus assembly protein PilX